METDHYPNINPKWSWWDIALVLLILFAMIPVSPLLRSLVNQAFHAAGVALQRIQLFTGTAVQAGLMITAVMLLIRRKGSTGRDLGLTWVNARKNILTGLFGGSVLAIVVVGLGVLISSLTGPPPPQEVEKMLSGLKKGKDILLPFVSVSVLAPVSEEIYFRGMVYPMIRSKLGVKAALILSGLFFSSLHLDLFRLIPIWVGGIALAYFYEKTGSLITSIAAHSTWNTLMLVLMYLAGQFQPH